ncbi:peptidase M61 [Tenacibaculum finnmarkense]|uniref:M61 family metallopeptidase n=1 Tax=Tenacibaculum finnmarkense TaxID=2781243 RepID=UPI001EFAD4E6|nr:peptidase M61 [Tenacibaculum finnmarkense]MCG8201111.1 peptidase M61 [Tenacibaculum finnmarkense genomovar finnmarkense]MCG8878964.1 peptidase M61 [Tenacibaculum finnmarkense]MCM8863909.1 peptidase M61 [Tenacibaculum finnmarkense genomovar finnmarkense]MCM8894421.1 peptidase M61 [Tenacibaculum finnmarkense genomovar finnmarkense]
MKKIILGIVSLALFASCSTYKSVQKNNQTIAVNIDLNTVVDDKIMVAINPQKIKEETVIYNIPAIVPGTYTMSNYGKFVSNFKAFDYNGKELAIQKLSENSWQINNAKNMDKISYWVDDTFDSKKDHNIYVMAGTNIEEDKNFLLNLPGFIGYFNDKKELPYQISITHPTHLYETSSLINKNTSKTDNSKDVFLAPRYDEISDNPIMYAPLNNVSFTVNGIEVNLAIYSPNNAHKATDLKDALKTMMTAQTNFLKGFETTNEYNVLVYLFDPEMYKFQGYGALEHRSSTTVVYPETMSKEQFASNMINGTVSHEFFHIVSPLSVHSEEIHSFDFNQAKMSEHLWMYEGMTEYFANLFQVNQGLISEDEFINEMNSKIAGSLNYNDAMSFTKMSKNILEPKYAKNYNNVYQKGALIGMCLDIILREESNGTYGVRNLMLDLSKKYGKNKAFKDENIIAEIVKMTYPSVGEFFKNHVQGATPINYATYFEKVGVKNQTKTENSAYFIDSKGQPFISVNSTKKVFFTIRTNSALTALGIKAGDVLESVNNEKISLENIRSILGKTMQWKQGDIIKMDVTRNGKLLKLSANYTQPTTKSTGLVLEKLSADNKKVILRNAWLKN